MRHAGVARGRCGVACVLVGDGRLNTTRVVTVLIMVTICDETTGSRDCLNDGPVGEGTTLEIGLMRRANMGWVDTSALMEVRLLLQFHIWLHSVSGLDKDMHSVLRPSCSSSHVVIVLRLRPLGKGFRLQLGARLAIGPSLLRWLRSSDTLS